MNVNTVLPVSGVMLDTQFGVFLEGWNPPGRLVSGVKGNQPPPVSQVVVPSFSSMSKARVRRVLGMRKLQTTEP